MSSTLNTQLVNELVSDMTSFAHFMYKPAGFKVERRLAPTVDTLQFYINRFNSLNGDFSSSVSVALSSLNNSVAEADGKVSYIETTVQDAINSTAVEGGVLADTFVTVNNILNQRQLNMGMSSILELLSIENPTDGLRVYVKSYHAGLGKGGGYFIYDSSKSEINNQGSIINGWVRLNVNAVFPELFGAYGDGVTDDTLALKSMFGSGHKNFDLGGVVYSLGSFDATDREPFFLFVDEKDISITGASFKVETIFTEPPAGDNPVSYQGEQKGVFEFRDCSNIICHVDVVSNGKVDYHNHAVTGMVLSVAQKTGSNFRLSGSVSGCFSFLETKDSNAASAASRREFTDPNIEDIFINCTAKNSSYGCRFVNIGRKINAVVFTEEIGRSFFMVGVSNVFANINSYRQRSIADVVVKAYRNDCSNIVLNINSNYQQDSSENILVLEHSNSEHNTRIENVTANITVTNRGYTSIYNNAAIAVIGRHYHSGIVEKTDVVTQNIKLNIQSDNAKMVPFVCPSYPNSPSIIECNTVRNVVNTNGFTIKTGAKYMACTDKNPKENPLRICLSNDSSPTGVLGICTVLGTESTARLNFETAYIRQFKVMATLLAGDGTVSGGFNVIGSYNIYTQIIGGEPVATPQWGFLGSSKGGCLIFNTAKDLPDSDPAYKNKLFRVDFELETSIR